MTSFDESDAPGVPPDSHGTDDSRRSATGTGRTAARERGAASGSGGNSGQPPRAPASRGGGGRRSRRQNDGPNWRVVRNVAIGFLVLIVLLEGVSYVRYMTQPSSVPFGVRTVEWIRGNVSSWLVDQAEREYYSWTAPSKGGPTIKTLPTVGLGTVNINQVAASDLPKNVRPLIHPTLAGEGVWHTTGLNVDGGPAVLVTTFRSDPNYPRMVAGVAWVDQRKARVFLIPGRYEPPGSGPRGPMEVPVAVRDRLLATFNSGFRMEDITGGFYANGHLWKPLVKGMATAVGYANGLMNVIPWEGGTSPGPGVVFARQNLPMIVENGHANPNLSDSSVWGATLGNAIRVWRSGLGIDKYGNLIYAAADQQTVGSLAAILIHAGAVRAMETDINYEWVTFISYAAPNGHLPTKLLGGIDHGGTRYLVPDDRDFFAVIARSPVTRTHG